MTGFVQMGHIFDEHPPGQTNIHNFYNSKTCSSAGKLGL